MSTVTFANGKTLTSSALSQTDAENALQSLITSIIGATDANSAVRISWPTGGAPGWAITEDVCFLRATLSPDARINKSRDRQRFGQGESLTETVTYVRMWDINLILYGPSSFDHARLIKSAFYMSWTSDVLAASSLEVVIDIDDPRRMPELFGGQWWERSDMSFRLSELVTEVTTVPSMSSVEIDVSTQDSTTPRVIPITA